MKEKKELIISILTIILIIIISSPKIKEERKISKIIQSFKKSKYYYCIIANEDNIRGSVQKKELKISEKFLKICKDRKKNEAANIKWRK